MRTWILNAKTMDGRLVDIQIESGKIVGIHAASTKSDAQKPTTQKPVAEKTSEETSAQAQKPTAEETSAQAIDVRGLTVLPGLFDFQVHFREPGQSHKETMETGSRAAVAGGFTRVLCMANTTPPLDHPEILIRNLKRAKEIGLLDVYSCATLTKNLQGTELTDFDALKKAGAMAITDDGKGVQSDEVMLKAFELAARVNIPILDHAEEDCCNAHGVIHPSEKSKKWKLKEASSEGEAKHVRRGIEFSLKTKAHYHVLHTSTKASIDAIREGKQKGAKVTAEVSPHHLLLCVDDIPEMESGLDPNFKMNPPLRSKEDRDACVQALLDGTFDSIATDHAPHTAEEKERGFADAPFGIVGLETCFPLIYTHFVATGKLSLSRAVELLNDGPARCGGVEPNQIAVGAPASMTFVDLETKRKVDPSKFFSKSKNTPFSGWECAGWPRLTLYNGKKVFSEL